MATWTVIVPMCGSVEMEIEADNREEAITHALDKASSGDRIRYEFHRKLVIADVFQGEVNEIEAINKEDF